MSLNKFKLLSDQDDHFELEHPKGERFKVAKSKLTPVAVQAIQGLARGGSVQTMANGGTSVPEVLAPNVSTPQIPEALSPSPSPLMTNVQSAIMQEPKEAFPIPTPQESLQKRMDQIAKQRGFKDAKDYAAQGSWVNRLTGVSPEEMLRINATQQLATESDVQKAMTQDVLQQQAKRMDAENIMRDKLNLPPLESPTLPKKPIFPTPKTTPGAMMEQMAPLAAQFQQQVKPTPGQFTPQEYLKELTESGKAQTAAMQEYQQALQALPNIEDITNSYKQKDEELLKMITDNKVDPDRYMKNKSTAGKIGTFIAIALGGMAGGRTGTNLALEQVNKAINDDIKAQENDQSKAMNLWKINHAHYRDNMQARLATQNQMLTMAQAKIALAGSRATNAQTRMQAVSLIDQIEQQKQKQRLLLGMQEVPGAAADPRLINLLDKEDKEHWVIGYGKARTPKVADELNKQIANINNIKTGVNQLLALAEKGSSFSLEDRAQAQTVAQMLQGQLRTELVGPGAVSDTERKLIENVIANPLELTRLTSSAKTALNTMTNRVQDSLDFNLQQGGLKPKQRLTLEKPRK